MLIKKIFKIIVLTVTVSTGYYLIADNTRLSNTVIEQKDCTYNNFKLFGKIQFVENFADIKVKVVESFPDLKVKIVDSFPDDCGEWQIVDSFPDLKVQIVESFADIKIKYVESFPGLP